MTGCGTREGATYDEYKKEYCDEQFDLSDDKKKVEEKKFAVWWAQLPSLRRVP